MAPAPASDLTLIADLLAARPGARARFLNAACPVLWSVVQRLEPPGAEAEAAFLEIMEALQANSYARLKPFDGRAPLSTYLVVVGRDILSRRLARHMVGSPEMAWSAFERFFAADIRRRIRQRCPREEATWDDIYQDICLKLIEDNFRRVRAYDGRGSFVGYILTIVDRLLIDHVRREKARPRLPAAVARLPELEQAIYTAVVWERCPANPAHIAAALQRHGPVPQFSEIQGALDRLRSVTAIEECGTGNNHEPTALEEINGMSLVDASPNPEEQLLLDEEQRLREHLIETIRTAAEHLPADLHVYLQTIFSCTDPLPPRQMAMLMGCDVDEVYRLAQRARRWLQQFTASAHGRPARFSSTRIGDLDHGTAATRAN